MRRAPSTASSFLAALLLFAFTSACGDDNAGDAACPEGTIRSGDDCLPYDVDGGAVDGGAETDASVPGEEDGEVPDASTDRAALPLVVDDWFTPSGYMGDGEVPGGITDAACPSRPEGASGACHGFTYTPGDQGWAGVYWQHPEGNWGAASGLAIAPGATRVRFTAWGVEGGEEVSFMVGMSDVDGFGAQGDPITLTTTPTEHSVLLVGHAYDEVIGGFGWSAAAAGAPITFFVDDIVWDEEDVGELPGCTDEGAANYNAEATIDDASCQYEVTFQVDVAAEGLSAGDVVYVTASFNAWCDQCNPMRDEDGDGVWTAALPLAPGEHEYKYTIGGWEGVVEEVPLECDVTGGEHGNRGFTLGAAAIELPIHAFGACGDAPPPAGLALPFWVDEQFVMSGGMGDGSVEVAPCDGPEGTGAGACQTITWRPEGGAWAGFYFQHPENNWGDLPGRLIAPGATQVTFVAWGEAGGEAARFAVGMQEPDGFQVETAMLALSPEPTRYTISLEGVAYDEVIGAFAWFLENPAGADAVVFHLDDVRWTDEVMGEIAGCLDEDAVNFDAEATVDDGGCVYEVTFQVDLSAEALVEGDVVTLEGTFNGWCDGCAPMADEDGDGIWTLIVPLAAGAHEYKYTINGFDGVVEEIPEACDVVADPEFANRGVTVVDAPLELPIHAFGACGEVIPVEGCTDPEANNHDPLATIDDGSCDYTALAQIDLPITFDAEDIDYTFTDFGGAFTERVTDPEDPTNIVASTLKPDVAETWAGTTMSGDAGFASAIPFAADATSMSVRIYAPAAGLPVRLKVEDAADAAVTCEAEAVTTAAGAWETLTFDFSSPAPGTAALDPAATYNKASIFFDFGSTGEAQTWLWDDVAFIPGDGEIPGCTDEDAANFLPTATRDNGGCLYEVTFQVDLSAEALAEGDVVTLEGTFNGWCSGCAPMTDAGEGIWTMILQLAPGPYEYKYAINGFDGVVEAIPAACDVVDDPQFSNRGFAVVDAPLTLPLHAFGACEPGLEVEGCTDPAANNYNPDATIDDDSCGYGAQIDLPVTFEEEGVDYTLTDFGGADTALIADPEDAGNAVASTLKPADAQTWAGTTMGGADGFATPIPFAADARRVTARVFAPRVGAPVRLKVEDAADPAVACEAEALTTVAGAWETLTFDFNQPIAAALDLEGTYDKASIFFDFGGAGADEVWLWDDVTHLPGDGQIPGCTDEGAHNYNPEATVDDDSCVFGAPVDLPITFDDEGINYAWADFGGAATELVEDPTDAANVVASTLKPAEAEVWAGTTMSGPEGLASPIPFAAGESTLTVRVFSPEAGLPVRLKVEDAADAAVTCETEAVTAAAGAWETLSFDFALPVANTPALDLGATYDKASIFFNFGATGAAQTWLWDDVTFVPTSDVLSGCTDPDASNHDAAAQADDGSCLYAVTFAVDASAQGLGEGDVVQVQATFNGWCGDCNPLGDEDGDGVWTATLPLPPGAHEYKYTINGWEGVVEAVPLACDVTAGEHGNRGFTLSDAPLTLPAHAFGACPEVVEPEGILSWTFDAAADAEAWVRVADADSDEASVTWIADGGVEGGAIQLAASNAAEIGRAYIFQRPATGVDYAGATAARLSFDVKVVEGAPLVGVAVHLQAHLPGVGVAERFDLQAEGLNEATWTTLTLDVPDIDPAGEHFTFQLNLAAGAFAGAGGALLIDNVQLAPIPQG